MGFNLIVVFFFCQRIINLKEDFPEGELEESFGSKS